MKVTEEEYFEWLDSMPRKPALEAIGRLVKNCFFETERVVLPRVSWNYFDWLVEEGAFMDEWTSRMHTECPEQTYFSAYIYEQLWWDHCYRYQNDLRCPPGPPPNGWDEVDLVGFNWIPTTT